MAVLEGCLHKAHVSFFDAVFKESSAPLVLPGLLLQLINNIAGIKKVCKRFLIIKGKSTCKF
jgi:hypothetical protein